MSIESFITLSQSYAAAVKAQDICPALLEKRVINDYRHLTDNSKVRLFSFANHHNYESSPTPDMRGKTDAQKVALLEHDVSMIIFLETGKLPKMPLSQCAAKWIAVELANVPDPLALAADPQAPYPI